jgi:16S rRNA (cytosine1402-N4)-methyltransferase
MSQPASDSHVSVMLQECVSALAIKPDGHYLDATFGRGGHARAILQALGPAGVLSVMDRDPQAIAHAEQLAASDARVRVYHGNFSELISKLPPASLDGALLDLGVSSPQLDQAERGFSFQADGPLDMRMDPSSGLPASAWLMQTTEAELCKVLRDYGDEPEAKFIARALHANASHIHTTAQLAQQVAEVKRQRKPGRNPATQVFQAIRIAVNDELGSIARALDALLDRLKLGARMVVMAFHSLEDRIVKQFIATRAKAPAASRRDFMASSGFMACLKSIGKAQFAGEQECQINPRARSAVLRVAEKIA